MYTQTYRDRYEKRCYSFHFKSQPCIRYKYRKAKFTNLNKSYLCLIFSFQFDLPIGRNRICVQGECCLKEVRYKSLNIQEYTYFRGFPGGSEVKTSACQHRRCGFDPWVRKIPWRRKWQPAPVWTGEPGELQSMGLQKSQTRYTYFSYDSKPTSLFMA